MWWFVKGFNQDLPWCRKNMARGPPAPQNPAAETGDFSGHVFPTSQQPLIKTYNKTHVKQIYIYIIYIYIYLVIWHKTSRQQSQHRRQPTTEHGLGVVLGKCKWITDFVGSGTKGTPCHVKRHGITNTAWHNHHGAIKDTRTLRSFSCQCQLSNLWNPLIHFMIAFKHDAAIHLQIRDTQGLLVCVLYS